jgi:anti-sigma factor RsiW
MRHERHYTLEEARERRGWVAARVELARAAIGVLGSADARAALGALDVASGGAWPGRSVAQATLDLQRAFAELQAEDIVVRDVIRGLVDFPAVLDGEEVYLCWLVDEPEIEHWHELDAGFGGRRRLGR